MVRHLLAVALLLVVEDVTIIALPAFTKGLHQVVLIQRQQNVALLVINHEVVHVPNKGKENVMTEVVQVRNVQRIVIGICI